MQLENFAGLYSILAGIALTIYWIALYKNDEHTPLISTVLLKVLRLGRDIIIVCLSIIGGVAVIANFFWAFPVYLISMGLLIISLCDFTIYHWRNKDMAPFGFFLLLTIAAVVIIILMIFL